MFTPGRIAFIIFFLILFIGYLIWAYREDIKQIPWHFKGTTKIILILIVIYLIYYTLNRWVL